MAGAAGLSICALSYAELDNENRLYASAATLRLRQLGKERADFGGDSTALHLIARRASDPNKPSAPAPAMGAALLQLDREGDAAIKQLAVAAEDAAERAAGAAALIARAVAEALGMGRLSLVAPAAAHAEEARAWLRDAGFVERGPGGDLACDLAR